MADQMSACPTVMLCGYYGEKNLGDDALLEVLLEDLPEQWRPLITAHDPGSIQDLAPGSDVVNRRSLAKTIQALSSVQVVVLGGGSLLQDSTSFRSLLYYLILIAMARLQGRTVVLWGQGLGPLRSRFSRWLVASVLRSVQRISWRDPESLALAQRWQLCVPMRMAPDPVWQIPMASWAGGEAVVLCWRPTALLDQHGWLQLIRALEELLAEVDAPLHWLAFHRHQDAPLLSSLERQSLIGSGLKSRSRTVVVHSVAEAMNQFSRARLVLPMRLHALILAALSGAPSAALSYDPKVASAARMAGLPCADLRNLPSASALAEQWKSVLDRPASGSAINKIREQAGAHGKMLREALAAVTEESSNRTISRSGDRSEH